MTGPEALIAEDEDQVSLVVYLSGGKHSTRMLGICADVTLKFRLTERDGGNEF